MSEPTGIVAHLIGSFVDGVPKYLATLLDYVIARPRRFFLRYEQDPQRYIAPWPFLLINALLAAGLALAIDRLHDAPGLPWDWSQYWSVVPAGFVSDIFVLVCGALAAVVTRQRVTISSMFTAFAYASAWVLVLIPSFSAIAETRRDRVLYISCVCVMVASGLCHIAYLVASFVSFNYLAGRRAVYFVVLTVLLTAAGGVTVGLLIPRVAGDRFETQQTEPQEAIRHSFLGRCDRAWIQGTVGAGDADVWAWFEWGPTPALGNATARRLFKENVDDIVITDELHDLSPSTTYFYRLALSSKYGTKHAFIRSFTTSRCVADASP